MRRHHARPAHAAFGSAHWAGGLSVARMLLKVVPPMAAQCLLTGLLHLNAVPGTTGRTIRLGQKPNRCDPVKALAFERLNERSNLHSTAFQRQSTWIRC